MDCAIGIILVRHGNSEDRHDDAARSELRGTATVSDDPGHDSLMVLGSEALGLEILG
jgi:hypothetical protein